MAEEFRTIITAAGQSAIANAIASGTDIVIDDVAVGDSNGVGYNPSENQTALVHEVYRANNDGVSVLAGGIIQVELNIPASSGGYHIREAGVFSSTGVLLAVVRIADRYKPLPASGQADELTLILKLDVGNVGAVTWTIDPARKDRIDAQLAPDYRSAKGIANAPPVGPAAGDTWIVGTAPTGLFAGKAGWVAEWSGLAWTLILPPDRFRLGLPDDLDYVYDAAAGTWGTDNASETYFGRARKATAAEVAGGSGPGFLTPQSKIGALARAPQVFPLGADHSTGSWATMIAATYTPVASTNLRKYTAVVVHSGLALAGASNTSIGSFLRLRRKKATTGAWAEVFPASGQYGVVNALTEAEGFITSFSYWDTLDAGGENIALSLDHAAGASDEETSTAYAGGRTYLIVEEYTRAAA